MKLLRELVLSPLAALLLLTLAATASAQSIEEKIRPVGELCLQGQSCVGTLVGESASTTSVPEAVAATPATAAAVEPTPEAAAAPPAEAESGFDVAATYQMSCFACHATGAAGAPMLGDEEAWAARMEQGMDTVMANVINGLNAMPPKGLCMDCSDNDLRALVDYMLAQ